MKMKNKGIVYKVTHKESGQSYIGVTTDTMESRKADHIQKANKSSGGPFQDAIATQGPEAFVWTQIDTANSIDELAQKEKEYVMKYDSKQNGFNADAGGGMQKTVFQYSIEDGSLINTYDSLQSAADSVGVYKSGISSACLGVNKTCKGYYWSYVHPIPLILRDARKKKVIQMDLGGAVIDEFDSISHASRITGISKTCISRCCRKEREKSGGFLWKYL
jgi:predicted GIY-YIG superfamily endonuclease